MVTSILQYYLRKIITSGILVSCGCFWHGLMLHIYKLYPHMHLSWFADYKFIFLFSVFFPKIIWLEVFMVSTQWLLYSVWLISFNLQLSFLMRCIHFWGSAVLQTMKPWPTWKQSLCHCGMVSPLIVSAQNACILLFQFFFDRLFIYLCC